VIRIGRRGRRTDGRASIVLAIFLSAIAALAVLAPAAAAPGDIGHEDMSTTGAGDEVTGEKPESKAWFNDGFWWASLYDTATSDYWIWRLDVATQAWSKTATRLDDRPNTRADTLWDGTHLYVASHVFSRQPASGFPSRLYRFSYSSTTKSYTLDAGFPATINNVRSETLVIDKDSTGTLWATWIQSQKVFVNRTTGSDTAWGTPFTPNVAGTSVAADDISAVVAFGPGNIGLMWSNQSTSAMYFAVHPDGAADTSWDPSRTAVQGPGTADDHINLKTLQSSDNRVFAMVKTSHTSASAPLIMLLARDPATGNWTSYPVGRVQDHHTRPILLIDPEHRKLHVFATAPEAGGAIYEKTTSMDSISFAQGLGTPVIVDASNPMLNNATTTKQPVTSATGLLVLASNDQTDRYWHHYDSLGGTPPPPPTPTPPPTLPPTPTPTVPPPPTPTPTPTPTPGGGTVTFAAAADAQVLSSQPGTNYGTRTNLSVRNGGASSYSYHSYLRFDVSGLSGAPASAKLRLFVTDASSAGGDVSSTTTSWTEGSITWSNAPPPAGGTLASAGATTVGQWVELDVTGAITGNGSFALELLGGSGDSAIYSSREGANPPQLVITAP